MKRALAIVLAILMVSSAFAAPASAALIGSDGGQSPITYGSSGTPSFVVTFSNGSYSDLSAWAEESDLRDIRDLSNETRVAVVSTPKWDAVGVSGLDIPTSLAGVSTWRSGDRLEDVPWVESVGLNYNHSVGPVEDPITATDYTPPSKWFGASSYDVPTGGIAFQGDANRTSMAESRAALGADNVSATGGSATAPLAIIDTGANTANGQVFGDGTAGSTLRIADASKNTINNQTVAKNGTSAIADGSGHGTWTAAAAAANATGTVHDGIAPDAQLLIMKALADDGSGATADIVEAIRYSADQNASVISMSLGSPMYSDALASAVEYAQNEGSVVVAAAGNSRLTRSPGIGSPADVEGVIAVGATTGEEPVNAESAYFSQYSGAQPSDGNALNDETVDVAAPGFNTTARTPTDGGAVTNSTLSGTSMATPMVSAGVYVARANNADWSVSETRSAIEDATRPVPKAGAREVGNGMHAVDYAINGESGESQDSAMTDAAVTRDTVYGSIGGSNYFESLGNLVGVTA